VLLLGTTSKADVGAVVHVWDCVIDAVGAVGRARAGELIGQARQRHAHADRGRARAADVGLEGDSFRRRDAEAATSLTPAAKWVAGWSPIEGAANATGASIQDVGVDHSGADVLVTEELLDRADVVAGFQEVSREGVAKGVGRDVLV